MARKISEIYAQMVAEKDSQTSLQTLAPGQDTQQQLLNDLNSTSKVAIWRLLLYIVATAIWFHEAVWDLFRTEIENKISNGIWGTVRWYHAQVLKFQFGDTLTYNNTTHQYQYPVIDTAKKIVKRCSIVEQMNGLLLIKVAKFDSTIQPLSQAEQDALNSYIKKIRFAGTWFQVVSGNGDLLRIEYVIIYDPITPLTIVRPNVVVAIENYISNLPFDGLFRVVHLIDAIQSIEGVVDVAIPSNSVQTRLSTSANFTNIQTNHLPTYGYYKIDPTPSNTLNDTLTFIEL